MYYSISKSKSKFYSTSREPREGYEKIVYGKDNSETYHKYVDSIGGTLTRVSIENRTMKGAEFAFLVVEFLNNTGGTDHLSTVLKEYGRFTEQTKALISVLNGAKFGENYSLVCRTKKSDDGERSFLNLYMNYTDKLDENNRPMSTGFVKSTDAPKANITTDELGQKMTDYTDQNKFYTSLVSGILKNSTDYVGNASPASAAPTPAKPAQNKVVEATNPLDEFLKGSGLSL